MQPKRLSILAAAVAALALVAPASAQETAPATPEAAPAAPAPVDPATPTTPTEAPAGAAATPAAPAPAQPNIQVTEHGDWDVGCLAGTTNCEMQQVAADVNGNPVVLVRVLKLPADQPAEALAIFNTPLGTLLPQGLGFQIDTSPDSVLPFDWCVQEGCVVRLGLREPDVTALKRGGSVKLRVTSIADAAKPVELTLSLKGFTAGYDSLTTPPAAPAATPAPAAPAPATPAAPASE